mmetsp:Transcript_29635/g.69242  ORF Transcript_29635/g.69242 Transcript_29635/m.69242 type:complete len:261 (+) Transcript_29635:98-880(+)
MCHTVPSIRPIAEHAAHTQAFGQATSSACALARPSTAICHVSTCPLSRAYLPLALSVSRDAAAAASPALRGSGRSEGGVLGGAGGTAKEAVGEVGQAPPKRGARSDGRMGDEAETARARCSRACESLRGRSASPPPAAGGRLPRTEESRQRSPIEFCSKVQRREVLGVMWRVAWERSVLMGDTDTLERTKRRGVVWGEVTGERAEREVGRKPPPVREPRGDCGAMRERPRTSLLSPITLDMCEGTSCSRKSLHVGMKTLL